MPGWVFPFFVCLVFKPCFLLYINVISIRIYFLLIYHRRNMMGKIHIHEIEVRMTEDRETVENFLNSLEGEILAVIPNVHNIWGSNQIGVDFLWVVERTVGNS